MVQRKGIIDAEKVIGKLDMDYDWELSEHEARIDRDSLYTATCFFPYANPLNISSPSEIERKAEKQFEEGLSRIR